MIFLLNIVRIINYSIYCCVYDLQVNSKNTHKAIFDSCHHPSGTLRIVFFTAKKQLTQGIEKDLRAFSNPYHKW